MVYNSAILALPSIKGSLNAMKHRYAIFSLLVALMLLVSASPATAQAETCDTPVFNTVVTVGMIADIVKNIGGNCVSVEQLMGAGVDPHLYRASEGDVLKLLEADIVFYGGLHLEGRMADIFHEMAKTQATIGVADAIPEDQLLTEPVYHQTDPHVWMDAELWMYAAGSVRDTLVQLDPAHEAYYRDNADAYLETLTELDTYAREQIARVPADQRVLVTAHDAFQYFGRAYGIEVFAPQGITTTAEAGIEDIRQTIDLITERHIPAVFVESSVPPDVVEAIVEGVRARGAEVQIGGNLYSDSMGADGTPDGSYVGMIRHNVDTIVSALLGETTPE
jgi:manganese/zinc/iron transport system substrate-binding protein